MCGQQIDEVLSFDEKKKKHHTEEVTNDDDWLFNLAHELYICGYISMSHKNIKNDFLLTHTEFEWSDVQQSNRIAEQNKW